MAHVIILKDSFIDLKKRLFLLVPDVIMLVMNIILALIFLMINGDVFGALIKNPGVLFQSGNGGILDLLNSFPVQSNLWKLIVSFAGFVIANFLFGAGLMSVKYVMIKDFLEKKKTSLKKGFRDGGRFMVKVVGVRFFVFIFISALTLILNFVFLEFVNISQSAYFLLLVYLLGNISFFFINLFLLFRYPILFLDGRTILGSLKGAFGITLRKPRIVFLTWLIIFLITTFVSLFFSGLFGYLAYMGETLIGLMLVTILFYVIRSFINLVVTVWMDVYLFKIYITKK